MKKLFILLVLTSGAYATSVLPVLEAHFNDIKKLRASNTVTPHVFHKVDTINDILEGKKVTISQKQQATPKERIEILGGLLQNEILAKKFGKTQPTYIDPNLPTYMQHHLVALKVMRAGVQAFMENPFLMLDLYTLCKYLPKLLTVPYGYEKYLSLSTIDVLFPQGTFIHLANYINNFKDYDNQKHIKVAITLSEKYPFKIINSSVCFHQQDSLSNFNVLKDMNTLFCIEDNQLTLSDNAINQISRVQKNSFEILEKEKNKAIEESAKGTKNFLFKERYAEIISNFKILLKKPLYTKLSFITSICEKIIDKEIPRTLEDRTFIQIFEKADGEFEDNFFTYILCVHLINLQIVYNLEEKVIFDSFGKLKFSHDILSEFFSIREYNIYCNKPSSAEIDISIKKEILIEHVRQGLVSFENIIADSQQNTNKEEESPLFKFFYGETFLIDMRFPQWSYEQNKIDFSGGGIPYLVDYYGFNPFYLSLLIFQQLTAQRIFFQNEQNRKRYTYAYDNRDQLFLNLALDRKPLTEEDEKYDKRKDTNIYFAEFSPMLTVLLAELFVKQVYGDA